MKLRQFYLKALVLAIAGIFLATAVSPTISAGLSLPTPGPLSNSSPANIYPWAIRIGPNSGLPPSTFGLATPQAGRKARMRTVTSRFRTDRRSTKGQPF